MLGVSRFDHGDLCDSVNWTLGFWILSPTKRLALPTVMRHEHSTVLRELDLFPSSSGNAWIKLLKRIRRKEPFSVSGSFVDQLVPIGIIR